MANNEQQLVHALSSLPPEVKARLSRGTPEQKKIFIDGLSQQLSGASAQAEPINQESNPMGAVGNFIKSQRPANIIGGIPTNLNELSDIARVSGRQVPGMRGYEVNPISKFITQGVPSAMFDAGLKMVGAKSAPQMIQPPNTQYGKNLESGADALPFVMMAGGAMGGIRQAQLEGRNPWQKPLGPKLPSIDEVKNASAELSQKFGEASLAKAKSASSLFKESNKSLTDRFGVALKEKGFLDSVIPKDKAVSFFNSIKEKSGLSNKSPELLTSAEKSFLDFVDSAVSGDSVSGNDIYEKFKSIASQRGTRLWSAFNDSLGKEFPNLQEVRSAFAPEIQDKKITEKIIKPYSNSGNNDVRSSFNFFKRMASGKLNQAELSVADAMERFLGKGVFDDLKKLSNQKDGYAKFTEFLKNRSISESESSAKRNRAIKIGIGLAGEELTIGGLRKTAKKIFGL